ncbi:Uma2 family endonuclease [Pirellulaceae bacterium SH449]
MSSAERPEHFSVDDYLALEENALTKSDYIDGWIRAMAGGSVRHNRIKSNCMIHLGSSLKGNPCRPYDSDMKVSIRSSDMKRFYYPDVQVVCKSNDELSVFQDHPVLVIEVLSPSTRRYDLDEKMSAYLTIPSLKCYIALEQHQPIAIVMRRTENGFLREVVEGLEASIDLPFLGCALPMREIYEDVEFTPYCVQEPDLEYEIG